jgi:hypothetical protein
MHRFMPASDLERSKNQIMNRRREAKLLNPDPRILQQKSISLHLGIHGYSYCYLRKIADMVLRVYNGFKPSRRQTR